MGPLVWTGLCQGLRSVPMLVPSLLVRRLGWWFRSDIHRPLKGTFGEVDGLPGQATTLWMLVAGGRRGITEMWLRIPRTSAAYRTP
jgi:hypothetical protein